MTTSVSVVPTQSNTYLNPPLVLLFLLYILYRKFTNNVENEPVNNITRTEVNDLVNGPP